MKYRRHVPKALSLLVNKREFIKVVKSEQEVMMIDLRVDKALKIIKSDLPDEVKEQLVKEELSDFIKEKQQSKAIRYSDAARFYIEQSNVTRTELTNRLYFFNDLFPALLKYVMGNDPIVEEITPAHLNRIAGIISKLPSRNQHNLKVIETYSLVVEVARGKRYEHTLHVDTVNKLIKRIRSLALFGQRSGLFKMTASVNTIKYVVNPRDQRKALSVEEIETLIDATSNQEVIDFINLIRYTGLRTSEVFKCEIKECDGIMYFDLSNATALKTTSSYRKIPMHPKVKAARFTYTVEHLSRIVKKLINEYLDEPQKKTLYSLRHSFASELVTKGVRPDIVSELLGHQHQTMTLSRYAKGFSVEQLYEAVSQL